MNNQLKPNLKTIDTQPKSQSAELDTVLDALVPLFMNYDKFAGEALDRMDVFIANMNCGKRASKDQRHSLVDQLDHLINIYAAIGDTLKAMPTSSSENANASSLVMRDHCLSRYNVLAAFDKVLKNVKHCALALD